VKGDAHFAKRGVHLLFERAQGGWRQCGEIPKQRRVQRTWPSIWRENFVPTPAAFRSIRHA
jgi:hypothetical protein